MLWICVHVGAWAEAATGKVLVLQMITGEVHRFAFLQANCKKQLDVSFCHITWNQAHQNMRVMEVLHFRSLAYRQLERSGITLWKR